MRIWNSISLFSNVERMIILLTATPHTYYIFPPYSITWNAPFLLNSNLIMDTNTDDSFPNFDSPLFIFLTRKGVKIIIIFHFMIYELGVGIWLRFSSLCCSITLWLQSWNVLKIYWSLNSTEELYFHCMIAFPALSIDVASRPRKRHSGQKPHLWNMRTPQAQSKAPNYEVMEDRRENKKYITHQWLKC